ncbi:hypothetical protein CPAR01_13743 [Colletotrichum paranaense]|uniref:Putative gamma-glutamylcyclotransferase n=1 Tax=Colletotrichum paranaense TaxID=1914294 RepID=A0ABQ9S480_9PEZI|nr:uncharacterized protein CPAR01_13743 [Colletotrichum paranaense]KAK1524795.1 hypothetical protein CPAR01_13743 [Colletotrichum paranaense]
METVPRPVFLYGTLCALPLLAWVLTGDATQVKEISALIRTAKVENVARYSLHGCDYPCAIREHGSYINGYFLQPQTLSQRKKLDDFEGEVYQVNPIQAMVLSHGGETVESLIEADIYLWNGDEDLVAYQSWDLEWFLQERLKDWIELFAGMEMVGGADFEELHRWILQLLRLFAQCLTSLVMG